MDLCEGNILHKNKNGVWMYIVGEESSHELFNGSNRNRIPNGYSDTKHLCCHSFRPILICFSFAFFSLSFSLFTVLIYVCTLNAPSSNFSEILLLISIFYWFFFRCFNRMPYERRRCDCLVLTSATKALLLLDSTKNNWTGKEEAEKK